MSGASRDSGGAFFRQRAWEGSEPSARNEAAHALRAERRTDQRSMGERPRPIPTACPGVPRSRGDGAAEPACRARWGGHASGPDRPHRTGHTPPPRAHAPPADCAPNRCSAHRSCGCSPAHLRSLRSSGSPQCARGFRALSQSLSQLCRNPRWVWTGFDRKWRVGASPCFSSKSRLFLPGLTRACLRGSVSTRRRSLVRAQYRPPLRSNTG